MVASFKQVVGRRHYSCFCRVVVNHIEAVAGGNLVDLFEASWQCAYMLEPLTDKQLDKQIQSLFMEFLQRAPFFIFQGKLAF